MKIDYSKTRVHISGKYHEYNGEPLYNKKFDLVMSFHAPGIAAARDKTGAYHINLKGEPIYEKRFIRSFGFYYDRAAVQDESGWYHIDLQGNPVYNERYAWVGNYQDSACPVRTFNGFYYHIDLKGARLYNKEFLYAGDYRYGIAAVRLKNGQCTHIKKNGEFLHGKLFLDLDVYHKSYARARDHEGWFHIDVNGNPLYEHRFAMVEAFYNEFAHALTFDNKHVIINEKGKIVHFITQNQ